MTREEYAKPVVVSMRPEFEKEVREFHDQHGATHMFSKTVRVLIERGMKAEAAERESA